MTAFSTHPLLAGSLSGWLLLAAFPVLGDALSPTHHGRLAEVHALMEQKRWEEAHMALDDLRTQIGAQPYARALLLQAAGWLYMGSGEPSTAIKSLREALALNTLPQEASQDTRYLLAQLLLTESDASAAAAVMDDWLATTKSPSAKALYLAGTAHALAGNSKPATEYLAQAVASGDDLPEAWGQRLLALRLQSGQAEQARVLLRRLLVTNADEKTYWLQLADLEAGLEGPGAAVAVLELARQRGLLRQPAELLDLAGRWLRLGVPERAARLLQDTLDDGRLAATPARLDLLADAWWRSGEPERARAALEQAIALAPEAPPDQSEEEPAGEGYQGAAAVERRLRLARMAAEVEDWDAVLAATRSALADAGPPRTGMGHLLAGMARHYLGHSEGALRHFELAAGFADTRADAKQWLASLRPAEAAAPGASELRAPPSAP